MPFITQYNSITYVNWVMFCITTLGLICQVHALLMYRPFLKVSVHAYLHTHIHTPANAKRSKKSDINLLIHMTVNFIKYR